METIISTDVKELCFHCGSPCDSKQVIEQDQYFCCAGCQSVYELIHDVQMGDYYVLAERPGASQKSIIDLPGTFDYLRDTGAETQLLETCSEGCRLVLHIPRIHCISCVWLLENIGRFNSGIVSAQVDFIHRELTVVFDPDITTLAEIVELLASIGYEPKINLDGTHQPHKEKQESFPIGKVAVAGFCFANTMLYSLPIYLDFADNMSAEWRAFFGWLNLLLAVPVVFYSGKEYLRSAWTVIHHGIVTIEVPIALGIMALFGRSIYEIVSGTGSGYIDSLSGFVFFLLLGKFVQQRTFSTLSFDRDFRSYFPFAATVLDGTFERRVPVAQLCLGDRLILRCGEIVPVDGCLNSCVGCFDYSFITGESRNIETLSGEVVYAGARNIGCAVQIDVTTESTESQLAKLWNHAVFLVEREEGYEELLSKVSRYFTVGVIGIAVLSAGYWLRHNPIVALEVFTSVLIVACPCALAISIPFTRATAVGILAKFGLFLRNSHIVERLALIEHIVCDKTGTLTVPIDNTVSFYGEDLTDFERFCISAAVKNSTHPLSRKISENLISDEIEVSEYSELAGSGLRALVKGVEVIVGSEQWLSDMGIQVDKSPDRDIATMVHISVNGIYRGYYVFENIYRNGALSAVRQLKNRFTMHLLSGDGEGEYSRLMPYFEKEVMQFNQSPEEKLEYVDRLQGDGAKVMMVGDGLNDAGALKASYVGVSMAEDANGFSPASDAILVGNNFSDLPQFLWFARASMNVAFVSMALSIAYNIVGLTIAVQGQLSPLHSAVLMPLSSVSIMVFTTGMTSLVGRRIGRMP